MAVDPSQPDAATGGDDDDVAPVGPAGRDDRPVGYRGRHADRSAGEGRHRSRNNSDDHYGNRVVALRRFPGWNVGGATTPVRAGWWTPARPPSPAAETTGTEPWRAPTADSTRQRGGGAHGGGTGGRRENAEPNRSSAPSRGGSAEQRRIPIRGGAALATAIRRMEALESIAWIPERGPAARGLIVPDIQFDVTPFIASPQIVDGVRVPFAPVHTVFVTAQLAGVPSRSDQQALLDALAQIEQAYPWGPAGMCTSVAYGRPYFDKLPDGLVAEHMPRLVHDTSRFVLEDAVPGSSDVHRSNFGVTKSRFNVRVLMEQNDLLLTFRSDVPSQIRDVLSWLRGSGRLQGRVVGSPLFSTPLTFTSSRSMFTQVGLPRRVAHESRLPFAHMVNPRSALWLGLADENAAAAAPPAFVTFCGAEGVRRTTARPGDYLDSGSILHLMHSIIDLQQFYEVDDSGVSEADAAFFARVRVAFGGEDARDLGPDARRVSIPEQRTRSVEPARPAPDGAAAGVHLRVDGPGFDDLDVPDGEARPKFESAAFFPTAEFFANTRREMAGYESVLTATRRQNYVIPPRRNRALPLVELT